MHLCTQPRSNALTAIYCNFWKVEVYDIQSVSCSNRSIIWERPKYRVARSGTSVSFCWCTTALLIQTWTIPLLPSSTDQRIETTECNNIQTMLDASCSCEKNDNVNYRLRLLLLIKSISLSTSCSSDGDDNSLEMKTVSPIIKIIISSSQVF